MKRLLLGAALLAMEQVGISIDERLFGNIEASLPRLGPVKS